jgi:hypothetical protein
MEVRIVGVMVVLFSEGGEEEDCAGWMMRAPLERASFIREWFLETEGALMRVAGPG